MIPLCPVWYFVSRYLLFVTGCEDICFDLLQPSSVSPLDLYHNCLFKSWLKISNSNNNDFSYFALQAIARTRLQKSAFIGWICKDFVAFILKRRIALGIKGGENCFTLTFNPYFLLFFSCKPYLTFFSLQLTILSCQRKLRFLLFN